MTAVTFDKDFSILDLENFAFSILNQLSDEFGIEDDGSFARAIQDCNDPIKMWNIIQQLQGYLIGAMHNAIPMPEKPEFPFGEFDNGKHWQGNL